MNWPALSHECSEAIADCLKTVVHEKPEDLLEFVAQRLSQKSGWNPKEFEDHFEECKRKPRNYVLEDQCPIDQDPLLWVPMRYNDDTIFETLRERAAELAAEIQQEQPCSLNTQTMANWARVAFPELSYLRGSPEEHTLLLTMRSMYLGCSRCPDVLDVHIRDEDPSLNFASYPLMVWLRNVLNPLVKTEEMFDVLFVACMLRIVGAHEGFRTKYGGGLLDPEKAVLHAIENEIESLPSFQRLNPDYQQLIEATLNTVFPFASLLNAEVVPYHFGQVKEMMVPHDSGVLFFLCIVALEHAVKNSKEAASDEDLDVIRLGAQSLMAVEKYHAQKAYELFLKKRAERMEWRIIKDDLFQRAVVRLCCLAGLTDAESWNAMQAAAEGISDREKEALKSELGRKDGIQEVPAYMMLQAGKMLQCAKQNDDVALHAVIRIAARVLDDAARSFDKGMKDKVVKMHFDNFVRRATEFRAGDLPFEDTAFVIEEVGGELLVRCAGSS